MWHPPYFVGKKRVMSVIGRDMYFWCGDVKKRRQKLPTCCSFNGNTISFVSTYSSFSDSWSTKSHFTRWHSKSYLKPETWFLFHNSNDNAFAASLTNANGRLVFKSKSFRRPRIRAHLHRAFWKTGDRLACVIFSRKGAVAAKIDLLVDLTFGVH